VAEAAAEDLFVYFLPFHKRKPKLRKQEIGTFRFPARDRVLFVRFADLSIPCPLSIKGTFVIVKGLRFVSVFSLLPLVFPPFKGHICV